MLKVPVTVIVPETTSAGAKHLLQMESAQVIVYGSSWQEANQHAVSLVGDTDAFLHPFDDPPLWFGHASMIDEVVSSGLLPDAVVLSVGGGGLLCGVIEGLERNGLSDIPVIAVETEGAASFNAAAKAGKVTPIERIASVASSLGAKQVCDQAVKYSGSRPVIVALVSDSEAVSASRKLADDHRIVTEPGCGAGLACFYEKKRFWRRFVTR